jgi:hypothetical protein
MDTNQPLTGLGVTFHEGFTSASLTVDIASGTFVTQDGTIHTYAGTTSYAIPTGTTKVLYLDGAASWALTTAASYPSTPHVRLATVVAGASTLTSVTDNRQSFSPSGAWFDGLVINVGTGTGLELGSSSSQKLAFLGATPVVQQAAGEDATTVLATFGLKAAEGTPVATVGAAAGSGGTASVTGTDRRGLITIAAGTATTSGILATIAFSATLGSAPKSITLTPANTNAPGETGKVFADSTAVTTAHFTINANAGVTTSTTTTWFYDVEG